MSLNNELDQLNEEVERLESEIKKIEDPFRDEIENLQKQISILKHKYYISFLKDCSPFKVELEKLFEERDQLTKELVNELKNVQARIWSMYQSIDKRTKKISRLQK